MKLTCPKCGKEVAGDGVNMSRAVLYCRDCHEYFELAVPEKLQRPSAGFSLENLPKRVRLWRNAQSTRIRLRFFTWLGFFVLPVFASVFSLIGFCGVYAFWMDDAPTWELMKGIGVHLFALAGLFLSWLMMMLLLGYTQLDFGGGKLRIFTGILGVGTRKVVPLAEIREVEKAVWKEDEDGDPSYLIKLQLDGYNVVRFGRFLQPKQMDYLVDAIRHLLYESGKPKGREE